MGEDCVATVRADTKEIRLMESLRIIEEVA